MNTQFLSIIIFFATVNLAAFIIMFWDKIKSQHNNTSRISEGLMFFMAVAFGSIGVYTGMFAFRHKTRKWYFIIGIPLVILENCAFLYLVYLYSQQINISINF